LGAHGGGPGAIVAAGTGSIDEALRHDGEHVSVGGWGYPVGDEGSGAWLGMCAMREAQLASDGRLSP
jgi:glucosamine kinase